MIIEVVADCLSIPRNYLGVLKVLENLLAGRGENILGELKKLSMLLRKQRVLMTIFETNTEEALDPFPPTYTYLKKPLVHKSSKSKKLPSFLL